MSIRDAHELKALQSRLTAAEIDLSAAREDARVANRKEAACRTKRDGLKAQIAAMTEARKEVVVTEHAILRYIERVYGIDLGEIKATMLSGNVLGLIDRFGSGKIPCEGGRLVVKDRVVVTVEIA